MTAERLRELRKKNNITQVKLARMLNISQGAITNWEKGKTYPDFENQKRLADIYGVTLDELFGRDNTHSKKGVKIPVLGRVQAGIPIEAIEEILDYEEITESMAAQGEYFGLVVRGDSMFPKMVEDDVVIVRKQSDCDSGDIAVVLVNGNDATVKKVKKTPTGLTLVPLNPNYEYISYTSEEVERLPVRIIGKVVELRRKF